MIALIDDACQAGARVSEACAVVESVKAASDVYAPVSCEVIEANGALEDTPELVNTDPYGEGWLAVIAASDWEKDLNQLLDAQAYFTLMRGQAEEETQKL